MIDSFNTIIPYVIAGGLFLSTMMYLQDKGVL